MGQAHVRVSVPPRLASVLNSPVAEERIQSALSELGLLRATLNIVDRKALLEEERLASELDVDADDKDQQCAICFTKQVAVLLLPCRHFVTCHRCTVMVRRMGKCPLCRQPIEDVKAAQDMEAGELKYAPRIHRGLVEAGFLVLCKD